MHVALIISGSLVVVGTILYIHHRLTQRNEPSDVLSEDVVDNVSPSTSQAECCGLHITCERDSLSPVFGDEIVYYEDEELDDYADCDVSDYTDDDIEKFRDVLLTLRPEEIAPWARSIQQRRIVLPPVVKDELFIIVEEHRNNLVTA